MARPGTLGRDQIAGLRRAVRAAQGVIKAFYDADPEQARRTAHDLLTDLTTLHRAVEPNAYGKRAGTRP